jgi:signal transduction histidine kinase
MTKSTKATAHQRSRSAGAVEDQNGQQGEGQACDALALLAHELRSPLGAICAAVQILQLDPDNPATREYATRLLGRQTHHMSRLIEGVLNFSRMHHGKVKLEKQRVDLAEVVNLAIEVVRPLIDQRGHNLEVVLPSAPLILDADPTWLAEALTNLVENAAKYTDPGGQIRLTAGPEGHDIVIRVCDNGIGIEADGIAHVFDLFHQSQPEDGNSRGGLGIGLALVRQIVALHGGSASASSAGPFQGSEFVVHLPGLRPTEKQGRFESPGLAIKTEQVRLGTEPSGAT